MITETAYPVISDDDVENITILYPEIDVQRQLASQYEIAVSAYFASLNAAHRAMALAKFAVESTLLSDAAEQVVPKTFGMPVAEDPEELDEGSSEADVLD